MTEAEKKEIVALVMSEISGQAVDFDLQTVTPQRTDILPAVRPDGEGGYTGVTLDWGGITDELTMQAKEFRNEALQAKKDTELLKGETNVIKSDVEDIYRQFNEAVDKTIESVRNVYQSDLNAESTARQTADNTLQQNIDSEASTRAEADTAIGARIDSETTTRESEVAELERVNAIQKYEIENLKAKAEGQIYREEIVDANTYKLDIPSSVAPYAELQKIGGKSVVWNQLRNAYTIGTNNGITVSSNSDGTINVQGTVTSIPSYNQFYITEIIPFKRDGRRYLITSNLEISNGIGISGYGTLGTKNFIFSNSAGSVLDGRIYILVNQGDVLNLSNLSINVIDLTRMFGAGNEPTFEECQRIFSADYYPYDAGTLKSFPVKRVRSVGKNLCLAKDVYAGANSYLETTLDGRNCIRFTSAFKVQNSPVRFKENTQYTVSFDLKMVEIDSEGVSENIFSFYYTDGTRSVINANKTNFTNWARTSQTSDANKTVLYVGLASTDYRTYCYVSNFQLEEGSVATAYTPYKESALDLSSVTSDLKSAGSVHDEWENGKMTIRVGTRAYTSGDESKSGYTTDGTTTYYPLDTPTEETVPEIDNYIQVEGGGSLTFESDETVKMPVPSTTRFVVDLT